MSEACYMAKATLRTASKDLVSGLSLQCNNNGQYQHDAIMLFKTGIAVVTVARQTREICHDRITRFGQTVKQRGLADVGAAHQSQYGFQNLIL